MPGHSYSSVKLRGTEDRKQYESTIKKMREIEKITGRRYRKNFANLTAFVIFVGCDYYLLKKAGVKAERWLSMGWADGSRKHV